MSTMILIQKLVFLVAVLELNVVKCSLLKNPLTNSPLLKGTFTNVGVGSVGLGIPPLYVEQQHVEESSSTSKNFLTISSLPHTNFINQLPYNDAPPVLGKCLEARGVFPTQFCNRYLNCWDGSVQEQTCPQNLLFNAKGYCDYPANVDCRGRKLEDSPTTVDHINNNLEKEETSISNEATGNLTTVINTVVSVNENLKTKCQKPRGQFPSDACHRYVNCWDELIAEEECPKGLLFSEKGYCDFPFNVICGKRTLPPNNWNEHSECPKPNGIFRDKTNCSRYFTCILNKVISRYECPRGSTYNEALGMCDYSTSSDRIQTFVSPQPLTILQGCQNGLSGLRKNCKLDSAQALVSPCSNPIICREYLNKFSVPLV